MLKTGVIGLGVMGAPMARNLHKAGYLHRIWNRTRSRAEELTKETDVIAANTIEDLSAECELIIICVSRDEDVLEVIDHISTGIKPGTIVIDMSTVSSHTAEKASAKIRSGGGHFLDCPVSGGAEGARNGTLSIMAGGDEAILERARGALSALGTRITYIGPTGSGQACKAVNQIICAGVNQAVTEGLAFGTAMGLDMDRVLEAISAGAAGNWFMDHRGRTMLAGTFAPGFKLSLHNKDLKICMDMANALGNLELPLAASTVTAYEQLMEKGFGDEDISALFRLKRPAGNTDIKE